MANATTRKKRRKTRGGKRPGAGRPPLPGDKVRDKRIAVRYTEDEYSEVLKRANGSRLSDWVRERTLE